MSKRQPPGHTRTCMSCGEPRGSKRKGWHFVTTPGVGEVGATCERCPRPGEPVRRIVGADGVARFRAVVTSTGRDAERRQQVTRTFGDLDAARAFVEQVRGEVRERGRYAQAERTTVAALCETWLASRTDVREVTRQGYRSALAPALRLIGSRDVRTLTVTDVESMAAALATDGGKRGQPLGARAVRLALVALGQAFDGPHREGIVERNVVRLARRPRMARPVGRDLEHWDANTLLRFRDTADGDPLAAAWRLTLTGLTRADVMGLRWTDVDAARGTVTVRQGRVALTTGGTATDDPKSSQRRRVVPVEEVHPGTMRMLGALRAAQAADRLRAGEAWEDSGLVVVDALGRGLRPEVYSDRFRRLCSAAGVPVIRLHSVRHSLAFMLHDAGVTPASAAALLGHTVEVHLGIYLPEQGADGIAAAASRLSTITARAR